MAMSNPNSLELKHFIDVPLMSFGTYEGRDGFSDPALDITEVTKSFDLKSFEALEDDIEHYYEGSRKIQSIEGDVKIGYLGKFLPK
jgi:hypothetical protein